MSECELECYAVQMERYSTDAQNMTVAGLNLIKQAISIYDQDLRLVIANQQFQRMFDLPAIHMKSGATFQDTIRTLVERGEYGHVDDIESFILERTEQAQTFTAHYFERTRANGSAISVEGSPLRQGGWVTVYTDITEIKSRDALLLSRSADLSDELITRSQELAQTNRALNATITALEEAKRELTVSQAQLDLTNTMVPAHIARIDRDGIYTYTNKRLSTIVPDRPNDIVGKHLSEALGAEVYDHVAPAFEAARRGEAPVLEFEHKSSGTHLRVAFTPDTDDQGVVNGAYLLSANVTEQALSRQALTHTRRRELAAQLTSGLAHDFGNLLTIIMGEQDRLSRLNNLPDKADRYLETIKSAARRGAELIDGLSQLDAQRTIDIRLIDFQIFLKETMLLAQATLPDGITLTLNNTLEASHLMLDSGFASDALLNLVFNSIDAMNGTGDISVNVSVQKHRLLSFAVEDTGSGFSDNALANGLAPFFTSKSDRAGRGLGLSTAFDFARSSGGTVRLSNRETGGACVTITLPYLPSKPNTPGMVLLVEDNAAIRETVRAQLQRLGNSVIETDNALEAEKLACMPDVTFVVSDLVLEGGPSGYDLAQTLRKNNVSVPILIITGLPKSDPRRQQAQEQYQVLQKPFNFGQLAERLQMDQTS